LFSQKRRKQLRNADSSYIGCYACSWHRSVAVEGGRSKLNDDKTLIVKAAGQAQKAVDYILGVSYNEEN
jgi:antirestriction protein ArdC